MDKRIIKTRKAIFDSFLDLLSEKDVNSISVVELCRRANINKSTFYLHYTGIDDCYKRLVDSYCERIFGIVEHIDYTRVATSPEDTVDSLLVELEGYMEYVIKLSNSVIFDNAVRTLKRKFIDAICAANGLSLENNYHQVLKVTFIVGGCIDMLQQALPNYRHDEIRDLMVNVIKRR